MFWHVSVCLSTGGGSGPAGEGVGGCQVQPVGGGGGQVQPAGGVRSSRGGGQVQPVEGGGSGPAGMGGVRSSRGGLVQLGGGGSAKIGQHREYLLHGGRYASCVHAGGLSCKVTVFGIQWYSLGEQRNEPRAQTCTTLWRSGPIFLHFHAVFEKRSNSRLVSPEGLAPHLGNPESTIAKDDRYRETIKSEWKAKFTCFEFCWAPTPGPTLHRRRAVPPRILRLKEGWPLRLSSSTSAPVSSWTLEKSATKYRSETLYTLNFCTSA